MDHLRLELSKVQKMLDEQRRLQAPLNRELEAARSTIRELRGRLLQLEDDKEAIARAYLGLLEASHAMEAELGGALLKSERLIDLHELPAVYQVNH